MAAAGQPVRPVGPLHSVGPDLRDLLRVEVAVTMVVAVLFQPDHPRPAGPAAPDILDEEPDPVAPLEGILEVVLTSQIAVVDPENDVPGFETEPLGHGTRNNTCDMHSVTVVEVAVDAERHRRVVVRLLKRRDKSGLEPRLRIRDSRRRLNLKDRRSSLGHSAEGRGHSQDRSREGEA